MKRVLCFIFIITLIFSITGCSNNKDYTKFKKEYEGLNGVLNEKTSKKNRSVSIRKSNIKYKSEQDIIDAIKNKETFVVYFGFAKCPWCRSVIEVFLDVCNEEKIDNLYYVDVENIRDVMKLDDNNKPVVDKKGTNGYYKLLDEFDSVLGDYKLYDKDNNVVLASEKRIYAPNMIYVKNGKVIGLVSGISDKQDNPYMELSDDIKKDTYNIFKGLLSK